MRQRKGRFAGQKRSDKRYWDEAGVEWASRFECEVFNGFLERADGRVEVRRTVKGKVGQSDSLAYAHPKRAASCLQCGSDQVVQWRSITPDLYVGDPASGYYVEAKGHFPGGKRAAYRSFRTYEGTRHIVVRFVLQKNERATKKLTMLEYFARYFKGVDVIVWDGPDSIPEGWLR
jgi:hypothetical protein